MITGASDVELAAESERQRRLFAFLYSTPAYRGALEPYSLSHLQEQLADMVRRDDWGRLRLLVTDDVLDMLVPTARYDSLAEVVARRVAPVAAAGAPPESRWRYRRTPNTTITWRRS
ncbi:hypothetical protein GCM10023353_02550 [Tomitella cavernea]|uniref:Uncharacterized protein n=1 Tax=Tomitella cavernea TaxID=1387982 RepID=A0ABP9C6Q7_9ACTN